jgi:hypothetical protein
MKINLSNKAMMMYMSAMMSMMRFSAFALRDKF